MTEKQKPYWIRPSGHVTASGKCRGGIAQTREWYPNYDKPWTKKHDALIRSRVRKGMRNCDIARALQKKLGRSRTAIALRAGILRLCECR